MQEDGPRRFGRFIKKGSKVLEKINLYEFSFQDMNEAHHTVMHDNAGRTIVHAKYHDPAEIKAAVHGPERFDEDLMPESQRRPIIMPLDFTSDWERDKKMRKARAAHGEDDDFEFEYQESLKAQAKKDEEALLAASAAAKAEADGDSVASLQVQDQVSASEVSATPGKPQATAPAPVGVKRPDQPVTHESLNVVGRAIKDLMHSPAGSDFVPVPQAALVEDGGNPEEATIDLYKQKLERQLADQAAQAEQAKQLYEEAKARGYQDGFRIGEEKAEINVREQGANIFGKVGELIGELSNLKHQILNNVQENFYELSQAMAEALLKREFSIKPESFATVMRRAISEAVEPGRIRIRLASEAYERLQALKLPDLEGVLVRDNEVAAGDFRVESNMSVVDVSVHKLIAELLEQADLNIFDNGDSEAESDKDDVKKAG